METELQAKHKIKNKIKRGLKRLTSKIENSQNYYFQRSYIQAKIL